jgi:hypothetical protein
LYLYCCLSSLGLCIVQYTARLNAEKVRQFVHSLNEGRIPKKRFNCKSLIFPTGASPLY